jgi:hypothetical protein
MIFKNKKIQKFIFSLLIVLIIVPTVLFSMPKKANAVAGVGDTVMDFITELFTGTGAGSGATSAGANVAGTGSTITNTGVSLKNLATTVLQEVLRAVARKALQEITKSTVNWINSGFHGSPLFLENSQSFFTDIAKTEIKTLVNQFGYDPNKFPFGQAWALNTINSYKRTLDQNASYSLNGAMTATQATNFRNNFNVGGWNGFLINTQYPQNNYLGFNMLATDQLARQLQGTTQTTAQKVQTTLQQGQGFLSPQICSTNQNYNNMTNEFQKPEFHYDVLMKCGSYNDDPEAYNTCEQNWQGGLNAAKTAFSAPDSPNNCPKRPDGSSGLATTTPGFVVGNQITKALGASQDSTTLAGQAGNALSTILGAVIDHFLDKGLSALASTVNPAPAQDTWSYQGANLNINGTSSSVWNGPDEEVILDKFKKQISGETDWTAKEGEKIIETGDTRVGTCSGIKDSKGASLPDITSIPNAQCIAKKGIWVQDADGKTYAGGKTTRVAVAGEAISAVGDTTGGDPAKGIYIPGDIANTQTELALMDSFDSSDPTNAQNRPNGIIQSIGGIILNTQTLDKCLPGPDKGWENRLKQEEDRITQKIIQNANNSDDLKVRASNDLVRELKFAVTSFKDWVSTKMMLSLPSAVLDIDAIQSINDSPQQLTETTASKRTKGKALAMLTVIKASLDPIKSQPDPGSADEKIMINMKKQYNAIRADISSTITVESTRATLATLNQQLNKILDLIPVCKTERSVKGWGLTDGSGKGSAININFAGITFTMTRFNINTGDSGLTAMFKNIFSGGISGIFGGGSTPKIDLQTRSYTTTGTELEQFCGLPIISGYSHGDVIRQDSSNGYGDVPIGPPSSYTFRNRDAEKGTVIKDASGNIIFDYTGLPMVNAEQVYGDITCSGTCSWGVLGVGPSDDTTSINIDCPTVWKSNTLDYTHAGDLTQ